MKVFISWSGERSKRVGEALRRWLPTILQTIKPYYTPSDIEKGTRWSTEIASELDDSMAGIFCVTRENLASQWLLFEAGAISKKVDRSLVCPILIDLDTGDFHGPLTQFQSTLFQKADIRSLILGLNKANTAHVIDESVLNATFEKFWPELESQVNEIIKTTQPASGTQPNARDSRELLEEILDLTRALAIQKAGGFKAHNELNGLISDFLTSFYGVFENDWHYTKACLENSDSYIDDKGSFINPCVEDEGNNWANRGGLLKAYRALIEYIETHKIDISTRI